jgi:DNA-binding winged helix-turn-helix (wHTH) protein
MTNAPTTVLTLNGLAGVGDFRLGPLLVSPARRLIEGPAGNRRLQPQIMLVFLCLAQEKGKVVTRRALFEACWGGAPVGDDSLNRALTAIRQVLSDAGASGLAVETVPRTGYRLVETGASGRTQAVQNAWDCWRLGLPKPDIAEIARLEDAFSGNGGEASEWGMLALLLRKAAEYAESSACADYVQRCEAAARRALEIDESESNARVALAGLAPLFGNWSHARAALLGVLSADPGHVPARHDFAVVEMATGRPSAAVPIIADLIQEDGLAAAFHYKRMYHLWTLGDVHGAEQLAARALQLWPRHPAIWSARFWILIFTDRSDQALRFFADPSGQPAMPASALTFLQRTAEIVAAQQAKSLSRAERNRAVAEAIDAASTGPAQAVSALQRLFALDAIDDAFAIARGYYLGQGRSATPLRWNAADASITDQHRRVTQLLFTPAARRMRKDPRFPCLCEDIRLSAYWKRFGIAPDFHEENPGALSAFATKRASKS